MFSRRPKPKAPFRIRFPFIFPKCCQHFRLVRHLQSILSICNSFLISPLITKLISVVQPFYLFSRLLIHTKDKVLPFSFTVLSVFKRLLSFNLLFVWHFFFGISYLPSIFATNMIPSTLGNEVHWLALLIIFSISLFILTVPWNAAGLFFSAEVSRLYFTCYLAHYIKPEFFADHVSFFPVLLDILQATVNKTLRCQ